MQPSTLVFICLCGSRALRPPSPVFTRRRRCSHSATPRGFGGTTKKTKKAKRDGRARPLDSRGRAESEGLFRVELRHADGIGTALGASAAAVGWESDANEATRTDVAGVAGAFLIHNALTPKECDRLAALANEAGFEEAPRDEHRDQQNGAVSLAVDLEPVFRRCAHLLPASVLAYRAAATAEKWAAPAGTERRRCPGAPEGLYELSGLNPRLRVYRYRADSGDVFRPHRDDCWPGSTLSGKILSEDGWAYAADRRGRWAFRPGVDRVSHLSMLLYLTDDCEGGATTFFDEDGGPPVPVAPAKGAALCFWQSFKLGRDGVRDAALAPVHEGSPVTGGGSKIAVRSDVLYAFPADGEAPAPASSSR